MHECTLRESGNREPTFPSKQTTELRISQSTSSVQVRARLRRGMRQM